ncbi:MAG: hypothetical protein R3F54_21530 [Alphaproteobacteria bacterium]
MPFSDSIMAPTDQRLTIRTSRQRPMFLQSWRTRPIRFSSSFLAESRRAEVLGLALA